MEIIINQSGYLDIQRPVRGFSKSEPLNYSSFTQSCNEYVALKAELQNKIMFLLLQYILYIYQGFPGRYLNIFFFHVENQDRSF